MPKVSVVMPVFNGEKYLAEAIETTLFQTFSDFEFIVVNEFGSNEKTTNILHHYAKKDNRMTIIQNNERVGLPKSLNIGIDAARGEYIARMDADDALFRDRFEKQVTYLDANSDVFLCGTHKRTLSPKGLSYEQFPTEKEELRATLLFGCDISHCSVMFRRKQMVENGWWYSDVHLSEDYSLWSRIMFDAYMANLPDVLVTYRWGFEQRTSNLSFAAADEALKISQSNISRLGVQTENYEPELVFGGFRSLPWHYAKDDLTKFLNQNYQLLCEIEDCNNEKKILEPSALHKVLVRRWVHWVCPVAGDASIDFPAERFSHVARKDLLVNMNQNIASYGFANLENISRFKRLAKALFRPIYKPYFDKIYSMIDERIQFLSRRIDNLRKPTTISQIQKAYTPYLPNEKVRIVFLFQMPSFWPSWDTLYAELINMPDVDVRMVLFDVVINENAQTRGAEEFLQKKNIEYVDFANFNLTEYNPHIVVYQTPYDDLHRPKYLNASIIKSMGFRIVYVTYGIEISRTNEAETDHFKRSVVKNSWRVYTFSEKMRKDYMRFITPDVVKSLGHPKFDRLFGASSTGVDESLMALAGGRKIVLWKMHFPMVRTRDDEEYLVTPDLHEYFEFSKQIGQFKDIFFIVMLHPKFIEQSHRHLSIKYKKSAVGIVSNVEKAGNAFLFQEHDYRPALFAADCFIVDRSAIMIEMGVFNKPVLYMSAKQFCEPLTHAVTDIVFSYCQGTTVEEMVDFVKMFLQGSDPKRTERLEAVKANIPFFDGKSGMRIAQDMIDGVKKEMVMERNM